jgi:hypothetical protein
MRSNVLVRTLVSAVAVAGIAAGGLATAGTSVAASAPPASVRTAGVGVLATQNFGLSVQQAKNVQCFMRGSAAADYHGNIDGQLGTVSWKGIQRFLKANWNYNDGIDGDPGPNTVKALQRMLASGWDYNGRIDGDAGTATRAAFARFANDTSVFFPC